MLSSGNKELSLTSSVPTCFPLILCLSIFENRASIARITPLLLSTITMAYPLSSRRLMNPTTSKEPYASTTRWSCSPTSTSSPSLVRGVTTFSPRKLSLREDESAESESPGCEWVFPCRKLRMKSLWRSP
jgi:hypothetical protein